MPKKSKKKLPKVTFRPKSSFQKDDCINRSADYNCPNDSTLEACCAGKRSSAQVRCCTDEKCKKRAAELARISVASFG